MKNLFKSAAKPANVRALSVPDTVTSPEVTASNTPSRAESVTVINFALSPVNGEPLNVNRDFWSRATLNCAGIDTAGAPATGPMTAMISTEITPEKSKSLASTPVSTSVLLPNSPIKT